MIEYRYHGGPRDGLVDREDVDVSKHVIVLANGQCGFYEWDREDEYEDGMVRRMCWNDDHDDLLELLEDIGENRVP